MDALQVSHQQYFQQRFVLTLSYFNRTHQNPHLPRNVFIVLGSYLECDCCGQLKWFQKYLTGLVSQKWICSLHSAPLTCFTLDELNYFKGEYCFISFKNQSCFVSFKIWKIRRLVVSILVCVVHHPLTLLPWVCSWVNGFLFSF